MMKRQSYRWFLFGAAALATAGCSTGKEQRGQVAEDFRLVSLNGTIVSLSEHRGNVVLLGFWAVG
ncbi:MAG TPA: hypothetical protein VJZ71_07095 [Phycisphaerae bacterium]|nr:hypothetical protein [Phycisphaerae bacterium]